MDDGRKNRALVCLSEMQQVHGVLDEMLTIKWEQLAMEGKLTLMLNICLNHLKLVFPHTSRD